MKKSAFAFVVFLAIVGAVAAWAVGLKLTDPRQKDRPQTAADADPNIIWTSETAGIDGTQLGLDPVTGDVKFRWRK